MDKPILIRCKTHGAPLALVATTDGKTLAVCPVCGSLGNSEDVGKYSSGLVSGILTEEQLIDLREQIRVAGKGIS
jgi:hypothetical protein